VSDSTSPTRNWRPRFSLLSALLLMTVAGLAIIVVRLWREVGPLRAEVAQLRNETGRLSVGDPTRVHAIEVRTREPLLWKWRVWVPEGQKNVLARYYFGKIPSSGIPAASGSAHLKPGESWVTL
jgi:hypothetical protein